MAVAALIVEVQITQIQVSALALAGFKTLDSLISLCLRFIAEEILLILYVWTTNNYKLAYPSSKTGFIFDLCFLSGVYTPAAPAGLLTLQDKYGPSVLLKDLFKV